MSSSSYFFTKADLYTPSLLLMLPNAFVKRLAQQHATCTSGPSLPSHIPDATARHWAEGQPIFQSAKLMKRKLTYQTQ
jgi:hypothetical protein